MVLEEYQMLFGLKKKQQKNGTSRGYQGHKSSQNRKKDNWFTKSINLSNPNDQEQANRR